MPGNLMACPLRSNAFQLPKHTVAETQPLQKSSLHTSTPTSAPWQRKTACFNPGRWLGEREHAPLLRGRKNSRIWDLNSIWNIHVTSNCSWWSPSFSDIHMEWKSVLLVLKLRICSEDVKSLLEQEVQPGMGCARLAQTLLAWWGDRHKALWRICLFKMILSFLKEAESQYCLL